MTNGAPDGRTRHGSSASVCGVVRHRRCLPHRREPHEGDPPCQPAVSSSPSTSPTSRRRPASTPTCSASGRPSSAPATPTSRSPTRRSSWSCSRTPGAASPLNHLGVEVATPSDVAAASWALRGRRAAPLVHRVGPLLPRRAGQGVGRRPRRAARRVGVLHRAGRRPRPGHRRSRPSACCATRRDRRAACAAAVPRRA